MTSPAGAPFAPAATAVSMADAAMQLWQRTGASLLLPVTGTSMLPLLHPGDQLVVTPGCGVYPVGAIIVFRQSEQLVVHRVVGRLDHGRVLTKGDNGPVDAPVASTAIVGVVTAVQREGLRLALDRWPWRLWGWLIARGAAQPALQRRLLRLIARKAALFKQ